MPKPILHLSGEWVPSELHLFNADGIKVEFYLRCGTSLKILTLFGPSSYEALTRIFNGFDFIEIFDLDREDGFHRDFGRYRIVYFIDDPFDLYADRYELIEADDSN